MHWEDVRQLCLMRRDSMQVWIMGSWTIAAQPRQKCVPGAGAAGGRRTGAWVAEHTAHDGAPGHSTLSGACMARHQRSQALWQHDVSALSS